MTNGRYHTQYKLSDAYLLHMGYSPKNRASALWNRIQNIDRFVEYYGYDPICIDIILLSCYDHCSLMLHSTEEVRSLLMKK